MSQIKTFNDLIDCEPKLKLGELIQLFLLGYDDKIYINIQLIVKKGYRSYAKCLHERIRIIDSALVEYYDCYIERLEDPCDNNTLLTVVINEEVINEENAT